MTKKYTQVFFPSLKRDTTSHFPSNHRFTQTERIFRLILPWYNFSLFILQRLYGERQFLSDAVVFLRSLDALLASGFWFLPPVDLVGIYHSFHLNSISGHSPCRFSEKTPASVFSSVVIAGRQFIHTTNFIISSCYWGKNRSKMGYKHKTGKKTIHCRWGYNKRGLLSLLKVCRGL